MRLNVLKKVIFILLITVLIGCTPNQQESGSEVNESEARSEEGGELRVAIAASPTMLDSHLTTAQVVTDIGRHIFETLVTVDSDYNVRPMLAESWEESEDGQTITFHLREGVFFHNGKELKAEDVVASLERWFEVSSLGREEFSDTTLEALDDYTVELVRSSPSPTTLSTLAYGGGNFASIMPKEIINEAESDGVKEYVGTGPFKFEEWRQDQHILLTKYEDYQSLDEPTDGLAGKKEALIDDLYFVFVSDSSTRSGGLRTGEYDVIATVNYDNVDQLNAESGISTYNHLAGIFGIFYNKKTGFFSEVKARDAIAMGINKEDILKAAFTSEENYVLNHNMMMSNQAEMWSSNEGEEQFFQYDPEQAKELLKEAGYNGEEIVIIASRDQDYFYNGTVVLQQQLEKLGINTNLEVYDWPSFLTKRSDPDAYDLLIGISSPKPDPTTMAFLRNDFVGWTESPELDQIIEEFKSAPSLDEAKPVYDDLQKWFYDYKPISKLGDYTLVYGVRDHVENYNFLDGPIFWNVTNNK
ncbi:ABC transporter substrate-binding protein [Alkalihalophilus pseudofirmus]|nr:ABC transporter substrate-binding protein [Alkalihalophilus pseudofirmus]